MRKPRRNVTRKPDTRPKQRNSSVATVAESVGRTIGRIVGKVEAMTGIGRPRAVRDRVADEPGGPAHPRQRIRRRHGRPAQRSSVKERDR
jgi:hypothetical protein